MCVCVCACVGVAEVHRGGRLVLADLNSGYKVEPQVFSVWMSILRQCRVCELWLLQVGVRVR